MEIKPEDLRAYYDSFFPMEVTEGGRMARYARRLFRRIRRGPYAVVVSQVVVGETHAVLMGRYRDHAALMERIGRLQAAFRDTGVCDGTDARSGLKPIDPKEVRAIVDGLLARVPELDGTDLVILAIALADPYAAYLLTHDHVLLRNEGIIEYERELREMGRWAVKLRITDTPQLSRRAPARPAR